DGDERDLDGEELEIDEMEELEEEIVAKDLREKTIVSREVSVASGVSVEPIVAREVTEDGSVPSAPAINKGIDVFRLRSLTETESFAYFTYANDIPVFTLLD